MSADQSAPQETEFGGIVMLTTPMVIELAALSGGAENGVLMVTQPVLSPDGGVQPVKATRKSDGRLEEFAVTSLGTSQLLREEAARVAEAHGALQELRRKLHQARAAVPLSTDVLRNPPDELDTAAAKAAGGSGETEIGRAVLNAAADYAESQSPSLPDEVPLGCHVQSFSSAVCSRGTKCCVADHQPEDAESPSPAVGLTVEDRRECVEEAVRLAAQRVGPEGEDVPAGVLARVAFLAASAAVERLAAVSEVADTEES